MFVVKPDILTTTGNMQLYTGQKSGAEIAFHASVDLFEDHEDHGILQFHASNGFSFHQLLFQ